ncbi:hypothetical protein ABMY35_08145 [Pseudoalteromonas sp. BZB3]|uniref:hypothetical protein n=1 Tax=Pseudoalteromonas sp. BZB3 TaxID=3136670 RepID=UPI0032C45B15
MSSLKVVKKYSLYSIFTSLILLMNLGCTSLQNATVINYNIPKSSYIGRGTNAGPILVGALGATGLALGIAIDKGISKEFDSKITEYQGKYFQRTASLLEQLFVRAKHISIKKIDFTALETNDNFVNTTIYIEVQTNKQTEIINIELGVIDFEDLRSTDIFWKKLTSKLKVGL